MKQIKTALLSYGMSGRVFHAPFIHVHSGFSLLGAWERSTKAIVADYPYVKSYISMEELLGDDEVELVIVNTPTSTHFDFAKLALESGKHVVVEKAFTTTTKEAEILRDIAQERHLKLAVFQNRRWDSDFLTAKHVLDQGLIGDVVEATIGFYRYKLELSPKLHKELPNPGAGILKDLGPHCIDQVLHLFGMPESVFAEIAITREGSQVDDYIHIQLFYPRMRAQVVAGYFFRESTASYAFHGTKGSFLKSRADLQEDQLKGGMLPNHPDYGVEPEAEQGLLHTELEGTVIRKHLKTLPGNYMGLYEGVYQSIATGAIEPVTALEGVHVMQIIDAAIESSERGRVVRI